MSIRTMMQLFQHYPFGFICLVCKKLVVFCVICGRRLCGCVEDWSNYDDIPICDDEHEEIEE